jgi:exopolysaccharide production protein ExoQ
LALIPLFITGAYFEGGLFGSKNQVGYSAEIGFYATLISFFITRSYLRRFVYLLCLALCAVCLVLSSSATSVLSLATTIGITCVALCLSKTPRGLRALLLIFSCIVGTMFLWFALSSGMEQSLFSALGKDSTLTGRTYLWSEGIKAAMVKPILGYGYHAFWVQGRSLAERYWYELDIPGRSGFHFHNTFIQIFVDLGVLGLITFSLLVFATCFKSIRYVLRNDADLLGIFSLGISFMLFIRAFTEVDIGGPFSLGPLLFYSIIPRLAMYQTLQAKQTI